MCLHSKLQLSRATVAPTLFQQNNPLTNTAFNCCTYYLPTDNLWQFPPIPKKEFQCRAEKHGKKWMCWNVHKWNSCGCQIHYTSSVLDSCRDESIVMNCFVEKWLCLEYLLWCCRHFSTAQKKAYARMHPEVCFHVHNPQRSHMKPSCHQRVTGQEKCCPTGPKLIVGFSEASEHHFLCFFLMDVRNNMESKMVPLKVGFWGSSAMGRPERTWLCFECEWKSIMECPETEPVTLHTLSSV